MYFLTGFAKFSSLQNENLYCLGWTIAVYTVYIADEAAEHRFSICYRMDPAISTSEVPFMRRKSDVLIAGPIL